VSAADVLSALADPARLAMLGRIAAAGPAGCDFETAAAGAPPRDARRQVARLTAAGLVASEGPRLVARVDAIRAALEEVAPAGDEDDSATADARVRALFRRGRIVEIPRAPELRLSLLRHLAGRFEPGRTYREPEVNAVLREAHDDHAALRRYLVDAGLLARTDDGAAYRRAGDAGPGANSG
jgi:hypothetical protein